MFTKKDLQTGDFVVLTSGARGIYIEKFDSFIMKNGENYSLRFYDDDLCYGDSWTDCYSVLLVYRPFHISCCNFDNYDQESGSECVFDRARDTVQEMTIEEIEEKLGHKIKIVADKNNK